MTTVAAPYLVPRKPVLEALVRAADLGMVQLLKDFQDPVRGHNCLAFAHETPGQAMVFHTTLFLASSSGRLSKRYVHRMARVARQVSAGEYTVTYFPGFLLEDSL